MKATKHRKALRWGTVAVVTAIAILLTAGAIYAQGGPGMGRRGGPGAGQGMGQGPGQGGPMAFMFQDEEIRDLVGKIRLISMINELDLNAEQVGTLLSCAREAQAMVDTELGSVRAEVREGLRDQLDAVLRGEEFNAEILREIQESARESHDTGAMREALQPILERAIDTLSDEQRERITQHEGPRGEQIRERVRGALRERGFGGERLEDLNEEQRAALEEAFGDRIGEMRGQAARGKIMMMLLSPQAVGAFELWLDAH